MSTNCFRNELDSPVPCTNRRRPLARFLPLLLVAVPLAAYPLALSDYLNKSTVSASSDQFETVLTNNESEIQIIPNAELVIVKQVVNDDGGDLSLSDFNISTSAGALTFDSGTTAGSTTTFTSTTLYLSPGTYSLEEADVDGYAEGTWSCTKGILGSDTFDGGTLSLAFGEQTVCTIVNDDIAPTLTLAKSIDNGNGGSLGVADFDISIDGTEVGSGTPNTVLANTGIVVSELDMPGYTEGSWSCVDANGLTSGLPAAGLATGETINLEPGSDVTCSINNDDIPPTLTLVKNVINTDGGDATIADFDISIDATEVISGAATTVLANTDIVISELNFPGYTEGTWSCSDANSLTTGLPAAGLATGETIQVKPGANVTCSIENDDIAPKLTLDKTLLNDNGGNNTIADFDISIDGIEVTDAVSTTQLANTDVVISELDLPGYTEGTWSCVDSTGLTTGLPLAGSATGETIQIRQGGDVICSITNDDLAPTLTLAKSIVNDNGGDHTVLDFDISVDGTEVADGVATTVAANTNIVISELDLPGYTEGTWSCVDSSGLTSGLPTAGSATGETISLAEGAVVTCSIENNDIAPTLTLLKTIDNGDGGDLTIADFDISIDGTEVASGVATTVLANTNIVVSELDVAGYTEGTWSCSDASSLASGLPTAGLAIGETIVLESGSAVTCSIENDDIAPLLTLAKTVDNGDGGDLGVADFDISVDGTEVGTGVATTVVANTGIVISELDLDGYTEGTWACVDANGLTSGLPAAGLATGETITLKQGADVTCSITNDDIAPKLTLTKSVINADGGDLTVADFDISIDGTEVLNGVSNAVAANSNIVISELDVDGYTEGTWSCVDATGLTSGLPVAGTATGETIVLKQGADVNCSIANDDIAPILTLDKTLVNDNGGSSVIADFDISIDGSEVGDAVATTQLANTNIVISELDLPGYTEGSWSCVDANGLTSILPTAGLATGETIVLKQGADVTCSITNDDLAPSLTLSKTIINNAGGDHVVADFDISIDGVEVTNNAPNTVASNTLISIGELDLPGYTSGTWECVDSTGLTSGLPTAGLATGEDITLVEGAVVTCSITNEDIAPLLTLVKTIDNGDGGDLTIGDFDISIDGTEASSGTANTVLANTDIVISELDVDGYTPGSWSCVDSTSLTSGLPAVGLATGETIVLESGSNVTCSINNDDVAPLLTLDKTVINDNGGDLGVTDFDISIDGTEVGNAVTTAVMANTAIVVSELDLDGYTEGSWACTDANGLTSVLPAAGLATGESIILKPGSNVTCAIVNDDIAPLLTLFKEIDNGDGGDLTIADFDISIDATEVVHNVANAVAANTAIVISELDMDGYTEGTWSCVDANSLTIGLPVAGIATGETLTLKQGSNVTCSIRNDDIAPLLTLDKEVVNDNGGDKLVADFDISIDGTVVADAVANTVLANTPILISELDLVPYAEGSWSCIDANGLTTGLPTAGLATGESITLKQGADVTCSIVNNDLGIDLKIVKTVDDNTPNIGQTITFTLEVTNAGPDVATNATVIDVVPAGFTYVVGSISGGSVNDDTDPTVAGLSWMLNSVPVGSPFILTFDAVVNVP